MMVLIWPALIWTRSGYKVEQSRINCQLIQFLEKLVETHEAPLVLLVFLHFFVL